MLKTALIFLHILFIVRKSSVLSSAAFFKHSFTTTECYRKHALAISHFSSKAKGNSGWMNAVILVLKTSVSSSQSYREAQTTALRLDPRTRT